MTEVKEVCAPESGLGINLIHNDATLYFTILALCCLTDNAFLHLTLQCRVVDTFSKWTDLWELCQDRVFHGGDPSPLMLLATIVVVSTEKKEI